MLLILGGLVAIALFAALIGPYFVNWNDYKSTFEAEAEKILGQPVRVAGTAKATLLPSPSLTFTNVQVGDTEGEPMMTVERFDVTIELMPLLQGEIHVISMKLQKPHIRIAVDDSGTIDWLIRSEASKALDPEKVALDNVEIADGGATYIDARTGVQLDFDNINASVKATSLSGPWGIEGTYRDRAHDNIMQFQVSTGRQLPDGSIRVKTDINPANAPLTATLEGVVTTGEDGLAYAGTYSVSQVVTSTEESKPATSGWRSEGTFNLTRDRLAVDKAVLSQGPPDRPASLAGSLAITFGKSARFSADVAARQLDLDRSLGKGPSEPINVGTAAESLVDRLAGLYVPPIPGRVTFNVPAIVVGGAVIQDVGFQASPQASGWQIGGFRARLPGQSTLEADGMLSTGAHIGFGGRVRLAVVQPATFASWWRGRSDRGAGRLLAPFDLSGRARIEPGRIALETMSATIGDTKLSGGFAWTASSGNAKRRLLETDISATRVDFVQIKALAELLVGTDLNDTAALADSYAIKLAADELAVEDIRVHDISVDAGFVEGTLTVNALLIGDIGGARVSVTRGQVEDMFGSPRGQLVAHLNATTLSEFAGIIDRVDPGSAFSQWLTKAAPAIAPIAIDAKIEAPPADGSAAFRMTLHGSANASTFDAHVGVAGTPAEWRTGSAYISLSLSSYDALNLARQTGWAAKDIEAPGSARLDIVAKGIPAQGLDASIKGNFAGIDLGAAGKLILAGDAPAKFDGTFKVASANLDPIIKMTGLEIPGAAPGIAVSLDGKAAALGPSVELQWDKGAVAGREIGGRVTVAATAKGTPRFDGDLAVDAIDLGWLTELSLGVDPLPTGDPGAPWSKASFTEPVLGVLSGKVNVAAPRMTVRDGYEIANAKLGLTLDPGQLQVDLASGEIAGGVADGGVSIHNVGGNVNLSGHFSLTGAGLEPFVWQRGGRSVATGTMDAAANFEATGRSPAGLVSALTGGGTLAIHNGEARYINPRAASLVIKAADLGQEFTDQALSDLFASYVDAGTLPFGEAGGAFAIAAGTVRLKSLSIDADNTKTVGSAAVDLNQMTLDSDWTVVFDPGDNKVEGTVPQVGLVFRGPLAAPTRIVDVLQFGSYLNIRQEQRLQEILSTQEAVRQEKERFNREKRKIREDEARTEREAREALAARVDAAGVLEDFHARREADQEQRAAEELRVARVVAAQAAKAVADKAVAEKTAADNAETDAVAKAAAARARVEAATSAVADARAAEAAAAKVVDAAATAAAGAKSIAADAAATAATAKQAAEAATADAAAKASAARQAIASAGRSADEKAAAETDAKAAAAALASATEAETRAEREAVVKEKALEGAQSAADQAAADAKAANDAVARATADRQEAERALAEKMAQARTADAAAASAATARDAAVAAAKAAADRLVSRNAALQEAEAVAGATKAAYDKAGKDANERASAAAAAAAAAKAASEAAAAADAEAVKAKQALVEATAGATREADAARAAQSGADSAKAVAAAARQSSDQAGAALATTRESAAAAAADAAAKEKVLVPLLALRAVAERALAVARDAAGAATKQADAAAAEAVAAAEKATAKRAEAARATPDNIDSANAAAEAAERAQADAAGRAGEMKAAVATAQSELTAKEAAIKDAEGNIVAPTAARDEAHKVAEAAAARVKDLEPAAQAAAAAALAKLQAQKEAEDTARKATDAAADAAEAVIEATANEANAEAVAKELAERSLEAQATAATAATERIAADQAVARTAEARDGALEKRGAAKAEAQQAAEQSAAAEAAAKAAGDAAGAADEAAAGAFVEQKAAEKKLADASAALEAAAADADVRKTAAEDAAARFATAAGEGKVAADALAAAKTALEDALAAEALAEKGGLDRTSAAKAANESAKSAAAAKAAADAAAKTAAENAAKATDLAETARGGAGDKAAAETAARDAAAKAGADRAAAEQALAVVTASAHDAEAAAKTASERAAAKAEAADAALAAADAAARAAGAVPAVKPSQLPAKAAEASAAPADALIDVAPVSPAAAQPPAGPPAPRKRPPAAKSRSGTGGPMILVPTNP